jgi:putative ABC transport system permease protein
MSAKKNIVPPKLANRLLHAFLREDLVEEVEGDLEEKFHSTLTSKSVLGAKLNYWYQVLNYLRLFAIRKSKKQHNNQISMIQNYLKISFRNLTKNKLFSGINISGMAISLASFMLIALFIYDELQFDKHVDDYSSKYRVFTQGIADNGSMRKRAMVAPLMAPTAAAEFPEVESYARFLNFNYPVLFEAGDKKLTEKKGGYADPAIFHMFSLKLLEGEASTALQEPNSIAISQSLKQKYFGDKPALGEQIQVNDVNNTVTAVFQDFSSHSHLQLNYFLSMEEFARAFPQRMQRWTWNQFHTYIQLKEGTNPTELETKMGEMLVRNTPDETRRFMPRLMPMANIHLQAYDHLWDIAVKGNIQTIYILSATAIFIIIIAILNFVNLSTARAVTRAKEVGVRKAIGALRTHLINQFISESVIISLIALLIGVSLAMLILPAMNIFTEKDISLTIFSNPIILLSLFSFAILMGIMAGAYPAFFLSSYSPTQSLSKKSSGYSGKTVLRKGLVVFQFILSFFLIIASFIVSDQHRYMRTANMGFDKDNLIVLQLRGDLERNLQSAKQQFINHPNIISGTMGYGLPGEAFAGDGIIDKVTNKDIGISMLTVDHDYVKTLGMEILAGRDFSKDILSDEKHAFIVSEQGAKMLGYANPKDALEHPVAWNRWDAPDSLKEGKIIGVVKDIQLNSMRETINPVILHILPFAYSTITLKVKAEDIPSTLDHLENTWKSFNTEWPFEYRFLDENFDRMYKAEEKLARLFTWFTTFTIFVACLGLFGLVVYSTSQKYKEISIRKVLGAGEGNLVLQLSKSYVLLIVIAFIISIPFSYYAAHEWLQKFAFRITITPTLFVKAALLIAGISLLTVGLQSFKAAKANPVDALKEL